MKRSWEDYLALFCAFPSIMLDEFVSMFQRIKIDEESVLQGSEIEDDPDA